MSHFARRSRAIRSLFLFLAVAMAVGELRAAKRRSRGDGDAKVASVLRSEAVDENGDRALQLEALLEEQSDHRTARWQSGFVRVDEGWERYDAGVSPDRAVLLDEYRRRRETTPTFAAAQLELANWCRSNGLLDRERAHLHVVLELAPTATTPAMLARLGRTRAGGTMTEREWARAVSDAEAWQSNFERWRTTMKSLAFRLSNRRTRTSALESLQEVRDPSAIPAMHVLLGSAGPEASADMVDQLQQVEGVDAARTLAWHAAFSPWETTREASLVSLRHRDERTFVPALLSTTRSPYRRENRILVDPRGGVFFRHLVVSETRDRREATLFARDDVTTHLQLVSRLSGFGPTEVWSESRAHANRFELPVSSAREARVRHRNDALRLAALTARAQENAIDDRNGVVATVNRRVGCVLSEVSGAELDEPDDMWNWWHDYMGVERYESSEKPVCVRVVRGRTVHRLDVNHCTTVSCLVAGTTVWTDEGPRAIETVTVGDRVLAKDEFDGELAYRPVLRTTVRDPKPTTSIRLQGGESVRCTEGHTFWVSGRGWMLARELEPGMPLHTVRGTARIERVTPAEPASTYNLVVDELHSYFVGESMVLSHDVTLHEATDFVVPGLRPELAASPRTTTR